MPLLPSTSPYDETTRQALVDVLDALVLDALALGLIVGKAERLAPECRPTLCELHGHLNKWVDRMADVSAALGGDPPGTVQDVAERNRIDDWPSTVRPGGDRDAVLREVADRVAQLLEWVADGVRQAGAAGAADVMGLLGKILGRLTKFGWRIRPAS